MNLYAACFCTIDLETSDIEPARVVELVAKDASSALAWLAANYPNIYSVTSIDLRSENVVIV